jgi:hypothetical protein
MISAYRSEPQISHPNRPHVHRLWMNFPVSKLHNPTASHSASPPQAIEMGKHTLACSNFFRIFRLCQQRRHSPAQIAAPRSNSMTCHPASHAPAARSCATWAIRRSACNLAAPLKPALGQTARQANEHCGTSATYPPLSQRLWLSWCVPAARGQISGLNKRLRPPVPVLACLRGIPARNVQTQRQVHVRPCYDRRHLNVLCDHVLCFDSTSIPTQPLSARHHRLLLVVPLHILHARSPRVFWRDDAVRHQHHKRRQQQQSLGNCKQRKASVHGRRSRRTRKKLVKSTKKVDPASL